MCCFLTTRLGQLLTIDIFYIVQETPVCKKSELLLCIPGWLGYMNQHDPLLALRLPELISVTHRVFFNTALCSWPWSLLRSHSIQSHIPSWSPKVSFQWSGVSSVLWRGSSKATCEEPDCRTLMGHLRSPETRKRLGLLIAFTH